MEKINLDTPLTDITFYKHNTRIHNILCGFMNLKTVRELIRCEKSTLRNQRNMGKSAMNVIYDTLEKYGLTLEMPLADIAIYENKSIADEVKIEDEMNKELEERQRAGRTFSDALEEYPAIKTEETPSSAEEEVLGKAVKEVFQTQGINLEQEVFWLAKEIFLHDMRKYGYSSHSAAQCAASVAVRLYTEVNEKLKKLKE